MTCLNWVTIGETPIRIVSASGRKSFGQNGSATFVPVLPIGIGGIQYSPCWLYDQDGNTIFKGVITKSDWRFRPAVDQTITVQDDTWFLVGPIFTGSFGGPLADTVAAALESGDFPNSAVIAPELSSVVIPEFEFEGGTREALDKIAGMAGAKWNINHRTGACEFFPADLTGVTPLRSRVLPPTGCDFTADFRAKEAELSTDWNTLITRVTVKGRNSDIITRHGGGSELSIVEKFDIIKKSENRFFKLHERTTIVQEVEMVPAEGTDVPYWSVAIDPSTRTITNDGCVTYTVTVTPHFGYTGTISLDATPISGLPAGVTATFTPDTIMLGPEATSELQICTDTPIDCCEPGTFSYFITDIDCSAVPSDCCALPFYPDQVTVTWTVQYYDTCGNLMSDDSGVMYISRDESCTAIENGENTFSNPYTGITYSVLEEGPANCRCIVA